MTAKEAASIRIAASFG